MRITHHPTVQPVPSDIKLVLLDIEGTTTSISFVAEELFPYIRQHLRFYLESTWSTSQTQEDLAHLSGLSIEDDAKGDKGRRRTQTDLTI